MQSIRGSEGTSRMNCSLAWIRFVAAETFSYGMGGLNIAFIALVLRGEILCKLRRRKRESAVWTSHWNSCLNSVVSYTRDSARKIVNSCQRVKHSRTQRRHYVTRLRKLILDLVVDGTSYFTQNAACSWLAEIDVTETVEVFLNTNWLRAVKQITVTWPRIMQSK